MKTVHLIGNAHLDPAWLWPKSEGVDAVLATARSACDRLDEYPQFVFTCGGSWFHRQVERHDPELFVRVRRAIVDGRWQLVGGMVIQPDCNLPSAESMRRQLAHGQGYFLERFGRLTSVGYNVDSFGHGAYLPRLLRGGGIDSYVFMRPGPGEMELPALFRWRSPDAHEVTAFRISGCYNASGADLRRHIEQCLAAMPEGIDHTMAFFGVGDHGGGPTRAQIEWIIANADAIPGARLVISHPRAFFDAVAPQAASLPVVTGELQHHAVGCYAVERRIKLAMRRAEARLLQAERAAAALGPAGGPYGAGRVLAEAWEKVLFNQFHDILGGTCIEPGSWAAAGELADAASTGEELITLATRRAMRPQARPGTHQVIVLNDSPEGFDDYIVHEPWLNWSAWGNRVLVDEDDQPVPHQVIEPQCMVRGPTAVLFRLSVPARRHRVLRIMPQSPVAQVSNLCSAVDAQVGNLCHQHPDGLAVAGWGLRLAVYDDPSDTWSHSCVNRFGGPLIGSFEWRDAWEPVESGPLRRTLRRRASLGCSHAWVRVSVYRGLPLVRLRLRVTWAQVRQLLRLELVPPRGSIDARTDLVSGGPLARAVDGLEYPLTGGLHVAAGGEAMGVAAPEVFSAAVEAGAVKLMLLRSPYAAHHDPMPGDARADQPVTDQGQHEFDIVLLPSCAGPAAVAAQAGHMLCPPVVWDLTG